MEHSKQPRRTFISTLRPISFRQAKNPVWTPSSSGKKILVKMRSMLPAFKIPAQTLTRLLHTETRHHPSSPREVSYTKNSAAHYLNARVQDTPDPLRTVQLSRGLEIPLDLLEESLEKILAKINSADSFVEPLDLCKLFINFAVKHGRVQLKATLLFPVVALQFRNLKPLSIISTPLAKKIARCPEGIQNGTLSMDQKRRLLLLTYDDPMIAQFPLLGVWVSGLATQADLGFAHPVVWSACVRYISSSHIREKVSPKTSSFILVIFDQKTRFFEVSLQEKPAWGYTYTQYELKKNEGVHIKFLRESKEKPPLPFPMLEDKQSTFESWSTPTKAEQLIQEQNKVLYQMQKQISDLQNRIKDKKRKKKGPIKRTAATNTTFQANKGNGLKLSTRSLPCRCSQKTGKENDEGTLLVPRILYNSDSSEGESELLLRHLE